MDINCVHSCSHQAEGKCTLGTLPAFAQAAYTVGDVDCPYYAQKQRTSPLF